MRPGLARPSAPATRGGTEARPALKLWRASARAASSSSRSSRRSTSAPLRTSTSAMAPPDAGDSGAATIYGMATDGGPAGAGSLRLLAAKRPPRLLRARVGLRAVAGQVFQPASRAAVPAVVPERDLERANAAVGVATNGGETLGPLGAALLLPVLDVRGVLLVDAASFLLSAVLLGFLPALPG